MPGAGTADDPWIRIGGRRITSLSALADALQKIADLDAPHEADDADGDGGERGDGGDVTAGSLARDRHRWFGSAAQGTVNAFFRRLESAAARVGHLVRGERVEKAAEHRIDLGRAQVTVVDLHALHERAQRFVVGVVLKRLFEDKEDRGSRDPLTFVVLDELNKYAPREGSGPIKEILLDIAERGRSLGIVLIGAQQTASEVERRIVANSSFRVVGRLDQAEAAREEYGFLGAARPRAAILKPGSMIVLQPEIPLPLHVRFRSPPGPRAPAKRQAAPEPRPSSQRSTTISSTSTTRGLDTTCVSSTPPIGTSARRSAGSRAARSIGRCSPRSSTSPSSARPTACLSPATSSSRRPRHRGGGDRLLLLPRPRPEGHPGGGDRRQPRS